MDRSPTDMALFPRRVGQFSLVAQLPALQLAHPESLVDRPAGTDIHPQAQHVTLDHAPVHLLGSDSLARYHASTYIRLAPLHAASARSVPALVLWYSHVCLSYPDGNWFCYISRAGFHRGALDCWGRNRVMAAHHRCRATGHAALWFRSAISDPNNSRSPR